MERAPGQQSTPRWGKLCAEQSGDKEVEANAGRTGCRVNGESEKSGGRGVKMSINKAP